MADDDLLRDYGWTAQIRDLDVLVASRADEHKTAAAPVLVSSIEIPSSLLVQKVMDVARRELSMATLNHSMRVFYYGVAIVQEHFPTWSTPKFTETYLLTSLLHDLGTTPTHMHETQLSFEFHGGLLALALLAKHESPQSQRESITEAIIRHQHLGTEGNITTLGALVQLATIFDNVGARPELVHQDTIESVVAEWPRLGWSSCFANVVEAEVAAKPWAHTTHLGGEAFVEKVRGNTLMAPWD